MTGLSAVQKFHTCRTDPLLGDYTKQSPDHSPSVGKGSEPTFWEKHKVTILSGVSGALVGGGIAAAVVLTCGAAALVAIPVIGGSALFGGGCGSMGARCVASRGQTAPVSPNNCWINSLFRMIYADENVKRWLLSDECPPQLIPFKTFILDYDAGRPVNSQTLRLCLAAPGNINPSSGRQEDITEGWIAINSLLPPHLKGEVRGTRGYNSISRDGIKLAASEQQERPRRTPPTAHLQLAITGENPTLGTLIQANCNIDRAAGYSLKMQGTDGNKHDYDAIRETMAFVSAPPSLWIDVKRFNNDGSKIRVPVDFPDTYVLQTDQGMVPFKLTSFAVHTGDRDGGHYVSYRSDADGTWHKIDDNRVAVVLDRATLEAAKQQAYLVNYSRLDVPSSLLSQGYSAAPMGPSASSPNGIEPQLVDHGNRGNAMTVLHAAAPTASHIGKQEDLIKELALLNNKGYDRLKQELPKWLEKENELLIKEGKPQITNAGQFESWLKNENDLLNAKNQPQIAIDYGTMWLLFDSLREAKPTSSIGFSQTPVSRHALPQSNVPHDQHSKPSVENGSFTVPPHLHPAGIQQADTAEAELVFNFPDEDTIKARFRKHSIMASLLIHSAMSGEPDLGEQTLKRIASLFAGQKLNNFGIDLILLLNLSDLPGELRGRVNRALRGVALNG